MTRIAVLHWHTSSVGGINTTLQTLRAEALSRGDEFDILASDPQKTKQPGKFVKRQRVRGGDTFITIDGLAPHHPNNVKASIAFLKREYDVVVLSFLCPHPTKAYGDEPLFMPLLQGIKDAGIPIVGYIHDAYWDSYKEFGELVLPLCVRTMVAQKAYGEPLEAKGYKVSTAYLPFRPLVDDPVVKREMNLVAWIPQWKNIKGIYKFWDDIRRAQSRGYHVELYGNGIEYYNIRKSEDPEIGWKTVVGKDHFAPDYSGTGLAEFFGCIHETEIPRVLSRAAFMADFQGSGNPKYAAYRNGSYNHTIIEALYYGCVPIVHTNMLKSSIPNHLLAATDTPEKWSDVAAAFDVANYDRAGAREYVIKNHSAAVLYDRILGR